MKQAVPAPVQQQNRIGAKDLLHAVVETLVEAAHFILAAAAWLVYRWPGAIGIRVAAVTALIVLIANAIYPYLKTIDEPRRRKAFHRQNREDSAEQHD